MLRGLNIRDMLIIESLALEFQPGLNVLTGETGAGKSILLDSLGFVLGWRGRAELVRQGADQGEVSAWFDLPLDHPAHKILEEAGLDSEGELILRRVNSRDGRKTAYVNDRRCSGEVLRRISETLIELHGQHDDRGLLNVKGHMALLDDYAGTEKLRTACRTAWTRQRAAQKALDDHQAAVAAVKEEEDFLRHAVKELDDWAPEPGEEASLDSKRRMMQAAERIQGDVAKAFAALGMDGAEGGLSDANRWLEGAASQVDGQLDPSLSALSRAMTELGEAQGLVETFLNALQFNPSDLEEAEERLFALRGLARKHGVQVDELAALADHLRSKLDGLDQSGQDAANLQAEVAAAGQAYAEAAKALTGKRTKAGAKLDKAMGAELAPLKMERAVFETNIEPTTPSADGCDLVSFQVATNPGAPAGALNKIASGGELSRFLLALKVCLSAGTTGVTMIFDEIDRGVGGATADAVGRRLAELGQGGQVLVVTHSPQVAALGQSHWRVEKQVVKDVTTTSVVPLAHEDRIDEIARMVAGDRITDEARAAAASLLGG